MGFFYRMPFFIIYQGIFLALHNFHCQFQCQFKTTKMQPENAHIKLEINNFIYFLT